MTGRFADAGIARSSVLSFTGSAVNAALGIVFVVLVGRLLGPESAGVVLQTISAFTIALALARAGMDSAALWMIPRLAADRSSGIGATARLLVAVSCGTGVVVAAALAALAPVLPVPAALSASIGAVGWFLPAAAVLAAVLAALRGLGDLAAYTLIGNVGLPALRLGAVAAVIATGAATTAIAVAWAAPLAVALVPAVAALAMRVRAASPAPRGRRRALPDRRTAGAIGCFAAPRVVSETLSQVLRWADVLVVGALAGPAAAGVYGAVTRLAAAGALVDGAVRTVVAPAFSRLAHRADRAGVIALYRDATSWLVLFGTPFYVVLAVFAPVVLPVFGPGFAEGAPALAVACAGAVVASLGGTIHTVLLMSGRSGLAAANKAVAVAVDLVLLVLLVPLWGVTGAALAWACACMADAALAVAQVRRTERIAVPLAAGLRPLVVAASSFGGAALLARLLLGTTWLALAVALGVGGLAFLLWIRRDAARLRLGGVPLRFLRPSRERTPS